MKQLVILGAFLILFFKGHSQITKVDSILHESVYRTYIIHTPPGFIFGQSLPLVLVLHGSNGSAHQVMTYTGFNTLADTANFIVVYPGGYKNGWADGMGASQADTAGIDDVNFISSLIDLLHVKYNTQSNHVYAAGLSNGGNMVQLLACQLPHKIAAVASVAASIQDKLSFCNNRNPVPVLFIQRTFDASIPMQESNENNISGYTAVATANNSSTKQETEKTEAHPYLLETEKLNFNSFENSAVDIWNFFKGHPLKTCIRSYSLDIVKKNYNDDFTSFPNPVQRSLYLSYTNGSIDHVEIFDQDSKIIFTLSGNDITYPIDVSSLPRGLYMIKVRTGDGETIKNMMVKD